MAENTVESSVSERVAIPGVGRRLLRVEVMTPSQNRWNSRTFDGTSTTTSAHPCHNAVHALNFSPPRAWSERVIFAVDDEADDRAQLARLLEQPGLEYPCQFFASGGEMMDALLKVLRGAPPPLACFIDIKMAGMSGFDVLRWIRCQDALDCVPVIMLSSSEDPQKLGEARDVGAQCYVGKFPTAGELRSIITEAQRYCSDRSTPAAFHLPCNLLLGSAATPSRTAVA